VGKSEGKKVKIVHFEKETVEEAPYEEENYRSPYLNYNPKESEEDR
jgi:hypothetical protein